MLSGTNDGYSRIGKKVINPNIYSYFTLSWLNDMMAIGSKKSLEADDLMALHPALETANVGKDFERHYQTTQSLWSSIVRMSIYEISINTLWHILNTITEYFLVQFFLGQVLDDLAGNNSKLIIKNSAMLALGLFGSQLLCVFLNSAISNTRQNIGVRISSAVADALYKKQFRLSPNERKERSAGNFLNMVNRDATNLGGFIIIIENLWAIPFNVILSVVLLYQYLGGVVLVCVGLIGLNLGLTSATSGIVKDCFEEISTIDDSRVDAIRDVIEGIKLVKQMCMETYFFDRVNEIRTRLLAAYQKLLLWLVFPQGFSELLPGLMPVIAFSVYSQSNTLDPAVVFPCLLLFVKLFRPLDVASLTMMRISSFRISYKRVAGFLDANEHIINQISDSTDAVTVTDCHWSYGGSSQEENQFELKIDDLVIPKGSFIAVIGQVGAGKSTFLSALSGELDLIKGDLKVHGSIAYCPQIPWIYTGSIKENIEFYSEQDDQKLAQVLKTCVLEEDVSKMKDGIYTKLGEKGINLSGGQKARISLARAIYKDCDLYLLDDPTAALDAKVGREVFGKMQEEFRGKKTLIFTTHQLHLVKDADLVIVLDNGSVSEVGTFDQLVEKKGKAADLLSKYIMKQGAASLDEIDDEQITTTNDADDDNTGEDVDEIVDEENMATGSVKWENFKFYFSSWGTLPLLAAFIFALGILFSNVASQLYLAHATGMPVLDKQFILIYSTLGLLPGLTRLSYLLVCTFATLKAARLLHVRAMLSLLRAPISFFESQPSGRILNRFSSDFSILDIEMLNILEYLVTSTLSLIAAIFLVSVSTWYMLLMVGISGVVLGYIYIFYQKSNIAVKRLSSVLTSPKNAHVMETIAGSLTIRVFGVIDRFQTAYQLLQDEARAATFIKTALSIWLTFRMGLISSIVTLVLQILIHMFNAPSSIAGIALLNSIQLANSINSFLMWITEGEAEFNSVERIKEYCELPTEPERLKLTDPKEHNWPKTGDLEFNGVEFCYPSKPDVQVLKRISFNVQSGEKVGIVGRTGSGKSTLVSAIFRFSELSNGHIFIDGQDISKLGLWTLRKGVEIIPQDPILFEGSIRSNLDPFSNYSDAEIWEGLDKVGLKEYVSNQTGLLDASVARMGENLSVGQKQLLCLCRSILTQPKILILDEATSSIDTKSNEMIQHVIKTMFSSTSVLSIAHRLETIATFDKVIVLKDGELVEFDTPLNLLNDPTSFFSEMAAATGSVDILRNLTKHDQ